MISRGSTWFANLTDHRKGNSVPLREFPALFSMQQHTGFCGVLFVAAWFLAVQFYYPADIVKALWIHRFPALLALMAVFFGLTWCSAWALSSSNRMVQRLPSTAAGDVGDERTARTVRQWLAALSFAYVVVCAILIGLTGGVRSPFTLFYIMIYSLTVKRVRFPYPGLVAFAVFSSMLIVGCLSHGLFNNNARQAIEAALNHPYHVYVTAAALALALIVPTASALLVARQDAPGPRLAATGS